LRVVIRTSFYEVAAKVLIVKWNNFACLPTTTTTTATLPHYVIHFHSFPFKRFSLEPSDWCLPYYAIFIIIIIYKCNDNKRSL